MYDTSILRVSQFQKEVISYAVNLESERARAGITRTELARKIGVSLNTYSEYVKGAPMPSTKLCLLADMFGVTTDYILGRSAANAVKATMNST